MHLYGYLCQGMELTAAEKEAREVKKKILENVRDKNRFEVKHQVRQVYTPTLASSVREGVP